MRLARWVTETIAIVCILFALMAGVGGQSSAYEDLVEYAGAGEVNRPAFGVILIALASVSFIVSVRSWLAGRRGDRGQERTLLRWSVVFAAATLILFGIFGMSIMGASRQAFCPNFGFGAERCWSIRGTNIGLGRGLLIGAVALLLLLLIVIFVSGIGKQVPKADYPHRDDEMIRRIGELGALHDQGVLSDEEFENAKRRLLGEPGPD